MALKKKTTAERQIGLNQQAGSRLMGRWDLKKKYPRGDIFITPAFPPAASCSIAVTCGRMSLCPARSRALSLSRQTSRVQMNRTAVANPRRVFVFVDYRPLSGESGGRVGWRVGERKK